MTVTIVQICERLRNILSDLDAQQLHLPAIHVAKAIEVIEGNQSEEVLSRRKIFQDSNKASVKQMN